ncbi:MAG: SpoIIE family protein phosphatase [Novosphingobium sp.]|nr:SpoIIE family protein phosphatase [Novosphingobium sp.]
MDRPLSVLVVEDDELQAEYLSIMLEQAGCTVRSVGDGSVALGAVLENTYEMLVIDWQLPGIDGIDLTRRLRKSARDGSYMHIVMMTARAESETIRRAMEAGADDFLYKPFEPIHLELAIGSARRNLRQRRRLEERNRMIAQAHRETRAALDHVRADLEAAAALHRRLLPGGARIGPLEVSTIYQPAMQLGGDSIGVCQVDGGATLFFVVDVRGHGVPAALESFHIHHRLKGLAPSSPEALRRAMEGLNQELAADEGETYATILCGLVAPEQQRGWMIRAGHPQPMMVRGGMVETLDIEGSFPLGWFEDSQFDVCEFALAPGSALVVHSDGLEGEPADRLENILSDRSARPLCEALGQLDRELAELIGPEGAADDISVLVLDYREQE